MRWTVVVALTAGFATGCTEDTGAGPAPGGSSITADTPDAVTTPDGATAPDGTTAGDTPATGDGTAPPIEYVQPDWFPAKGEAADEAVLLDGLKGPARIVVDTRGIPHIYAQDPEDLARVQGYHVARTRLFQAHTLRMAASGRLAEILGSGSLEGDIFLRVLRLRHTAEAMAEKTKLEDPALYAVLEAYAAGMNAWIERVNAGEAPKPLEVDLFSLTLQPWTVADTMVIARLQTWDLAFGGYVDELDVADKLTELMALFDGTPAEGIVDDFMDWRPIGRATTIPSYGAASKPGGGVPRRGLAGLDRSFYRSLDRALLRRAAAGARRTKGYPHHLMRGDDFGSNNWVVSGAHTMSGKAMLANDPHLALRNPAVFQHVHLDDARAGGDVAASGVQFAGAPGVILGHNQHIAWGATVFFSDVTDNYVETLTPDKQKVMYKGAEVPLTFRKETFTYLIPGDAGCESVIQDWIANLQPKAALAGDVCTIEVTIPEVPHHGPIVPWTWDGTPDNGNTTAMSWRWTGFEPTDEVGAIWQLPLAKDWGEFKAALNRFSVGAQNWIYADTDGHIGWYPSHALPVRNNIASGDLTHPPYLPMPGDGTAEWGGFIPRAELPQAYDPPEGFLITANTDPAGIMGDNDPFNHPHYIGYFWGVGLRMQRIQDRLAFSVSQGDILPEDFTEIQADVLSPLGKRIAPALVEAIDRAVSGQDARAAKFLDAGVTAARGRLAAWSYLAESGVGEPDGSDEADDSIATSIFNAFVRRLVHNALADEGLGKLTSHQITLLLLRMVLAPEDMASRDPGTGESRLWDDIGTPMETETRAEILVKSLQEALAFLADPAKVGPADGGGFGTADMTTWRWGTLHVLRLPHNFNLVTPRYNIPDPALLPDGQPRHGDNFCVDASHPGLTGTKFSFSSGPSTRQVFRMGEPVERWSVIPGGQDESPFSPHYADEFALWAKNEAPPTAYTVEDVLAARERIVDLVPPSAAR